MVSNKTKTNIKGYRYSSFIYIYFLCVPFVYAPPFFPGPPCFIPSQSRPRFAQVPRASPSLSRFFEAAPTTTRKRWGCRRTCCRRPLLVVLAAHGRRRARSRQSLELSGLRETASERRTGTVGFPGTGVSAAHPERGRSRAVSEVGRSALQGWQVSCRCRCGCCCSCLLFALCCLLLLFCCCCHNCCCCCLLFAGCCCCCCFCRLFPSINLSSAKPRCVQAAGERGLKAALHIPSSLRRLPSVPPRCAW